MYKNNKVKVGFFTVCTTDSACRSKAGDKGRLLAALVSPVLVGRPGRRSLWESGGPSQSSTSSYASRAAGRAGWILCREYLS